MVATVCFTLDWMQLFSLVIIVPPLSADGQVDLVDHLNDIIICETHIDGGMKDANPMDAVLFYQTTDAVMGDRSFAMPQQQVSSMLGTVYQVSLKAFQLVVAMLIAGG